MSGAVDSAPDCAGRNGAWADVQTHHGPDFTMHVAISGEFDVPSNKHNSSAIRTGRALLRAICAAIAKAEGRTNA